MLKIERGELKAGARLGSADYKTKLEYPDKLLGKAGLSIYADPLSSKRFEQFRPVLEPRLADFATHMSVVGSLTRNMPIEEQTAFNGFLFRGMGLDKRQSDALANHAVAWNTLPLGLPEEEIDPDTVAPLMLRNLEQIAATCRVLKLRSELNLNTQIERKGFIAGVVKDPEKGSTKPSVIQFGDSRYSISDKKIGYQATLGAINGTLYEPIIQRQLSYVTTAASELLLSYAYGNLMKNLSPDEIAKLSTGVMRRVIGAQVRTALLERVSDEATFSPLFASFMEVYGLGALPLGDMNNRDFKTTDLLVYLPQYRQRPQTRAVVAVSIPEEVSLPEPVKLPQPSSVHGESTPVHKQKAIPLVSKTTRSDNRRYLLASNELSLVQDWRAVVVTVAGVLDKLTHF